jgi:hypothetical protein
VRKRRLLARASAGALAGIAAGLVAGAGARVAMRMIAIGVADGFDRGAEFTVAGTVLIVLLGAISGAAFGVVYEAIADRLPGPLAVRGLIFGLLALATLGPIFFANEEFFSAGRTLLFASLFPTVGVTLGLVLGPSRRIATGLPLVAQGIAALIAVSSGVLMGVGVVAALVSSGGGPM